MVGLGNGERALFWSDRWINEQSISAIVSSLIKSVPHTIQNKRTVMEAMLNGQWIADTQGASMRKFSWIIYACGT